MPGVAVVLMVAIPAALTGAVGVYCGRQSRKLELDKLKELHRQKVEDREHAELREAEAERAARVAARASAVQRLLQAADGTPPHSNVTTGADRAAWAEFNAALAVVELLHEFALADAGRKLVVGRWDVKYPSAREAFIEAARSF